jgi:hypothetical protein
MYWNIYPTSQSKDACSRDLIRLHDADADADPDLDAYPDTQITRMMVK